MSAEPIPTTEWPPPIKYQPWEDPEDIEDLIAEPAVDSFGEHWQRWPVTVEIVEYRVLWVEGPNRKKAIEDFENDGEWYEREGVRDPAFQLDVVAREPRDWEMRYVADRRDVYGPLREDGTL